MSEQKAPTACLFLLGAGVAGKSVTGALEKAAVVLDDVTVKQDLSATEAGQQYTSMIVVSSAEVAVDSKGLKEACKALVPGGKVVLMQPASQAPTKRVLVMCGMTSVSIETLDILGDSFALVQGMKPNVELGTKIVVSAGAAETTWKIDVAGEDDDLIDDDDLLSEEDRKPVVPKTDCATSKSACANCSCGRAEAEAKGVKLQLTQDMIENPQSACGSCGLGDAYRCATCPYRGLPSFEQGKKIQVPADFLTADA